MFGGSLTILGTILSHPGQVLNWIIRISRDGIIIELSESNQERIKSGFDTGFGDNPALQRHRGPISCFEEVTEREYRVLKSVILQARAESFDIGERRYLPDKNPKGP